MCVCVCVHAHVRVLTVAVRHTVGVVVLRFRVSSGQVRIGRELENTRNWRREGKMTWMREREREGERGTSAKPHEVEWVMNTRKLLVPQKIHFHLYILLDRGGREGGDRGETG